MEDIVGKFIHYMKPLQGRLLALAGMDVVYTKAIANTLYFHDENGAEIEVSDFLGGYGATLFGHNHPELIREVQRHFEEKRVICAQASVRSRAAELSERLNQLLLRDLQRDFITMQASTGAEAVELALKHAVFYYRDRLDRLVVSSETYSGLTLTLDEDAAALLGLNGSDPALRSDILNLVKECNQAVRNQKAIVVSVENGFHGKTNAALGVTSNAVFKSTAIDIGFDVRFIPQEKGAMQSLIQSLRIPYFILRPNGNVLRVCMDWWVPIACLILEPVQGEGGIYPLHPDVVHGWQEDCADSEIPIITDEIQSGMGRTGTFLYCTQIGLIPDYILLSKSLGGGIGKISTCSIVRSKFLPGFCMKHSSTFAEDDLGCSVALKALDLCERQDIQKMVRFRSGQLQSMLARVHKANKDIIADVRGSGLMMGIELRAEREWDSNLFYFLLRQGLLGYCLTGYLLQKHRLRIGPALGHHLVLRVEPSCLVTKEEIDRLELGLIDLCEIIRSQDVGALLSHLVNGKMEEKENRPERFQRQMDACDDCRKVAFIGHFIDALDVGLWDPHINHWSEAQLTELLSSISAIRAPLVYNRIRVKGSASETCLYFIGLPVSSAQMYEAIRGETRQEMVQLIEDAIDLAIQEGCQAVGLGGYTSILTKNGKTFAHKPIGLTTGNAFTVGSAYESLIRVARQEGIDPSNATAAVVGAAGNIGQVLAELLSHKVERLILIGRPQRLTPIYHLAEKLKTTGSCQQILVTDDLSYLGQASMIISASNAPHPLILPEMIGSNRVVICDLSVPGDVDSDLMICCPHATVIRGGVITSPNNPEYYIPGIPLMPGEIFACMSETILMGLEGINTHFSLGEISTMQVNEVLGMAKRQSFLVNRQKEHSSF